MAVINISPQPGPQTTFLSTSADIAIYGGAAGSGKSYALLLDILRNYLNPQFKAVIFRKTAVQIRNPGALWDESFHLYSHFNAKPRKSILEWEFKDGMSVKFSHLEYEKDVYSWQGSQLGFLGFDELVHFTSFQFWYLLSRLRSMSGVPGRIRCTCNPDVNSWVRTLINWWIGPDGFHIKERSGVLRWFIKRDDEIIWADTREELVKTYGADELPKSLTFIGANIYDNQLLLQKDPSYLSNLKALSRVDRMQLLDGNWNVKVESGSLFRTEWFPMIDAIPAGWIDAIRFWDRASSKVTETNKDPDWTRGLKLYKYSDGTYCIGDLKSIRDTPGQVERLIQSVAYHDGSSIRIMSQQDPGSAGVAEAENFIKMLAGFDVRVQTFSKDKITRAKPVSAQCEAGNIRVLRASWNDELFKEFEEFPDGAHDDIVDCLSGGFNNMTQGLSIADVMWRG